MCYITPNPKYEISEIDLFRWTIQCKFTHFILLSIKLSAVCIVWLVVLVPNSLRTLLFFCNKAEQPSANLFLLSSPQSWKPLAALVILLVAVVVGMVERAVETVEDAVSKDVKPGHLEILLLLAGSWIVRNWSGWQAQIPFERVLCKRYISGEFDFLKYECSRISYLWELGSASLCTALQTLDNTAKFL